MTSLHRDERHKVIWSMKPATLAPSRARTLALPVADVVWGPIALQPTPNVNWPAKGGR